MKYFQVNFRVMSSTLGICFRYHPFSQNIKYKKNNLLDTSKNRSQSVLIYDVPRARLLILFNKASTYREKIAYNEIGVCRRAQGILFKDICPQPTAVDVNTDRIIVVDAKKIQTELKT